VFGYYPNFGIGGFVAGTTPVALIKQTLTVDKVFHLPILTDELVFHQFGAVCGDDFSDSHSKT